MPCLLPGFVAWAQLERARLFACRGGELAATGYVSIVCALSSLDSSDGEACCPLRLSTSRRVAWHIGPACGPNRRNCRRGFRRVYWFRGSAIAYGLRWSQGTRRSRKSVSPRRSRRSTHRDHLCPFTYGNTNKFYYTLISANEEMRYNYP